MKTQPAAAPFLQKISLRRRESRLAARASHSAVAVDFPETSLCGIPQLALCSCLENGSLLILLEYLATAELLRRRVPRIRLDLPPTLPRDPSAGRVQPFLKRHAAFVASSGVRDSQESGDYKVMTKSPLLAATVVTMRHEMPSGSGKAPASLT